MSKASEGDGIPAELFQMLKDDAVKVLHSICQQIWKTQQWTTGLENVSFHSNPKERQCPRMSKLLHNCTHLTCQLSNAQNFPNEASTVREQRTSRRSSWIQKRRRNQRSNANIYWIIEKAREFQKNIYFCFVDYTKAFDFVDHNKLETSVEKRWEYLPPYLPPEKSVCRPRSNSQTQTWNNGLVSYWERSKGCILSPCLFNFYAEYIM